MIDCAASGAALGAVRGYAPEVALEALPAQAPEGDAAAVRRPGRPHRVVLGDAPALAGVDAHRPELAHRVARGRRVEALGDHRELAPVGRPGRPEPEIGDAAARLAGRAHDEDAAAVTVGAEGDRPPVGRESGVEVVLLAVGGERDRLGAVDPLREQVEVGAVALDEDEALAVGREAGVLPRRPAAWSTGGRWDGGRCRGWRGSRARARERASRRPRRRRGARPPARRRWRDAARSGRPPRARGPSAPSSSRRPGSRGRRPGPRPSCEALARDLLQTVAQDARRAPAGSARRAARAPAAPGAGSRSSSRRAVRRRRRARR